MKITNIADKITYSDEKLTKRIIYNENGKLLNFVLNFKPGQGVPPHQHGEGDLVIHVLSGSGEMVIDEKVIKVVKGDVIYFEGEDHFNVKNTGEDNMSLFVVIAPNVNPAFAKEV